MNLQEFGSSLPPTSSSSRQVQSCRSSAAVPLMLDVALLLRQVAILGPRNVLQLAGVRHQPWRLRRSRKILHKTSRSGYAITSCATIKVFVVCFKDSIIQANVATHTILPLPNC